MTPETSAELRRRHAALTPFALRFLSGGPGGEPYVALACEDGTPLPEPAFDAVLLFAELAAAELPALLDAAAERDALAADADKWQRAALTLQGDRDALTAKRDSLSWQVEALLAERDALAAAVARVETLATEWEARAAFNAASLDKHPDDFWHGMATKGRECVGDVRRALERRRVVTDKCGVDAAELERMREGREESPRDEDEMWSMLLDSPLNERMALLKAALRAMDAEHRCVVGFHHEAVQQRDALAAKVARVRDWLDRRGVDASDRDGAYMDGYRAAQRHAVIDAAELRAALDEEAQP